jgi:hypothetical protein
MIKRYAFTLIGMAILIGVISISLVSADTFATIDFENGLGAGNVVGSLDCSTGITCSDVITGAVKVVGFNSALSGNNTAMIFDSSNPTCDDADLGTPNGSAVSGGPGVGAGGATDPFINDTALGNVLIVAERLSGGCIPDDADIPGVFLEFDFSDFGTGNMTVHNVHVMDMEQSQGEEAIVQFFTDSCGGNQLPEVLIDNTGDNGVAIVDLGGASGIVCMRVNLGGSGAIDNIQFTVEDPPAPAIDIRKQAEGPDSRTFPSGSNVTFEIVVTNTGNVDLTDVVVTDAEVPGCANSIGDLTAGASVTYTCTDLGVTRDYTNEACVDGTFGDEPVEQDCDPSDVVILVGGQGCTPGYWKQSQHFGSWTAPYTPDTPFSDVFDDAFPGKTLLQVLGQGGGGLKALGRHTVAALLNTANADVSYDLSTAQVISDFNDVFPDGDYETLQNVLAGFNEQGCPLGRNEG